MALPGDTGTADSLPGASVVGEMAELTQAHDWSTTPLGAMATWPASLQIIVGIMMASGFPMAVRWGPDFVLIYNELRAALIDEA
jgi:hypothetical protein